MNIALIYLAAGNSTRFGSNKLIYELDGKPMFLHLLEKLEKICHQNKSYKLFCITQHDEIAEIIKNMNLVTVLSPESKNGASFTIKNGLSAVQRHFPEADKFVFFVADQPYLSELTVNSFIRTSAESEKGILCVSNNGETGNPVCFSAGYFNELMLLTGDRGGKYVLRKHPDDVSLFEVEDSSELEDIDEKEL